MTKPTLPEMSRKVYEAMGFISSRFECFDCMAKGGLKYPGTMKGEDGICAKCQLEGKDIGLNIVTQNGALFNIGYILQWIENHKDEDRYFDYKDAFMNLTELIIHKRPKDKLSQPIPLDPDESRRPLLEFLLGLI